MRKCDFGKYYYSTFKADILYTTQILPLLAANVQICCKMVLYVALRKSF